MLPTARVLLPVSFTVLVEIYRYFRSGRQSELPEGVAFRINPIDDQSGHPPSIRSHAPSDLDPEILELIRTLDPAVIEWIRNLDPAFLDEIRKIRELSLKEKEEKEEGKERETQEETEKERESESGSGGGGNENGGEVVKEVVEESSTRNPSRRRNNKLVSKDKAMQGEELAEKQDQTESKYYLRSGGCKYGKDCRYSHSNVKPSVAPVLELNFLGLPIRPGERECPYYMRTGSCNYASNCRFNHPDPTAIGGSDPPSGFGKDGPASLQVASQSTVAPWSAPRPLNEAQVYTPMMIPPPQGVSSQNSKWNGYRAPAYIPERSMPARPPYMMNNSVTETNVYKQYPHQNQVEEFPERPGQPDCSYFLRTGDCKFKSNCKYHHPKTQTAVAPPFTLSDKGLPLRPDQNICTHYSRYGICKFGPACKFDHPSHISSSTSFQ